MNPKVAFHPAGLDACALYRMFLPHLHMPGSVFIFNRQGIELGKIADCQIAVVQRLYSRANYTALMVFREKGMKVVYDLDDDLWSVPRYNPVHKLFKQIIPGFNFCAKLADLITVSTEHLKLIVKRELGRECPRVEVVENTMDYDWFRPLNEPYRKKRNGRVVIGWCGTTTHEGDLEQVFSIIPDLLKELPEVDFELVGELPKNWESIKDRVRIRDFVPVAEFAANWASWQWDIALAPLDENKFNRSKSSIKLLESAAIGIPCVASRIASYHKFCSTSPLLKKTVMADSKIEWRNKITALVKDRDLRLEVGKEMQRVGKERYNILERVNTWKEIYRSLL